jgi:hypothetical protein
MPREKGFLGFGDDRTDKEAYEEGRKESRKANAVDDWALLAPKTIEKFVGDPRSSRVKAYDSGWEDGKKERGYFGESPRRSKQRSYGSGGGGSYLSGGSSGGGIFAVVILISIVGVCSYAYFQGERIGNEWSATHPKTASDNGGKNNFSTTRQVNSKPYTSEKPPNCERIIKKLKAGKNVTLPSECENAYQASKEAERIKLQEKEQTAAARQQIDLERQSQQSAEAERQTQIEFQQREESRIKAENVQRNREREAAEARQIEEEAENRRQQARQERILREQEKQRKIQENNERLIRLGTQIKNKIWKKNK